jgi:Asp-tRNA(Asn)/Glu-tRNA(Gln) amidotransferase A subunit family amidase
MAGKSGFPMLSALDLARQLEAGSLTPAHVADEIAERIAAADNDLGTFAHFDAEVLRHSARQGQGPLRGLPVAFKDIIETADLPTEYGSPIYKGWRPRADAPIVTMTLQAGGALLGKSTTTEFAFLNPADTYNPHHRAHTPGGSSAGSAAGVAAGLMPLAFGTQTGGSVIRPASFCGVAAIKPSFRMLPTVGVKTGAWTLDTLGLFGAGVEDVAFGLEAISGRPLRVDGVDTGTPTIGVCRMTFAGTPDAAAETALDKVASQLSRSGARVFEVTMPESFHVAHAAHPTIYNYEGRAALAWEIATHRDQLSPILLEHFDPATPVSIVAYDQARREARRARREAKAFFQGFDALLTYAAPGPAPDRTTTGQAVFNRLFTLLGTPAVNVAGLVDDRELPVGVQVVTAFGCDREALMAARYVEKQTRRISC